MTDDQFERLVVAAGGRQVKVGPHPGDRFVEFLRFLRLTGARPCEARTLRWTDINLDDGVVMLTKHKTSRTQRVLKPRVILLDEEIVKLLIAIRSRNEPGELVFYNHRGTAWNRSSLSLRIQRGRKKADIPTDVKLYGLRHAFGTRAITNGLDIKTLAELMGHTTTRMTEHYVHIAGNVAHLQTALQKVNGRVTPSPVSSTPREADPGLDSQKS